MAEGVRPSVRGRCGARGGISHDRPRVSPYGPADRLPARSPHRPEGWGRPETTERSSPPSIFLRDPARCEMRDLTRDVWNVDAREFPRSGTPEEQSAFLIRYAILAPSSHNAQPWAFAVAGHGIEVFADPSRWLPVADPDRRELDLSLGCALENLVVAAEHFGFVPHVEHVDEARDGAPVARVRLQASKSERAPSRPAELFDEIANRRTNRSEYDGRPVPGAVRVALERSITERGIRLSLTEDPDVRRRVDELLVRADALQFADAEWRRELGTWIGRGVFGTGWLISKMARLAVSHLDLSGTVARKDRELLRSASLLGMMAVDEVTRVSRVKCGQVFERLFLVATNEGLALQPMNQILQVEELRDDFRAFLPDDRGSPQILFRLGYAPPGEPSPRWPVEEVTSFRSDGSLPVDSPAATGPLLRGEEDPTRERKS